jgi:CDP-glucose 4,6-dehydratase
MESMVDVLNFYRNKTVLVTGHTGFKGSWLVKILSLAGAKVIGYALAPSTKPSLFEMLELENEIISEIGDIRDLKRLSCIFSQYQPEIVFHLAAQPIVRESYKEPVYTYDVNVMGTVNVCECVRTSPSVKSFLNVTTDKVYENKNLSNHPFKEDEKLNGYDPYSNSKSCSELVTDSYFKSFLKDSGVAVSTARAGNVIGGGDFSKDRIIPDCVRALKESQPLIIRNPDSTRPYQHVLEPLLCYLTIAMKQYQDAKYCSAYNIGPDPRDCVTTKHLIELFAANFKGDFKYEIRANNGPHEAAFLQLDNSKIKAVFGWKPTFNIREAIDLTAEWTRFYLKGLSVKEITERQIKEYLGL